MSKPVRFVRRSASTLLRENRAGERRPRGPARVRRRSVGVSPETLTPPAVVVLSARDPAERWPHRRSGSRARTSRLCLLVESPLLVLVDAPVDGGLHRRAGERARVPSADMPTGRAAPLRSGAALHRARIRMPGGSRYVVFRNAYRCLQLSPDNRTPFDRLLYSSLGVSQDPEEFDASALPPAPHPARAAYPSARVPRSEVRPEPPTEARRPSRGRLRPGRPAVRANHQRGIRRA